MDHIHDSQEIATMSARQPTTPLTIPTELHLQIYEYVFAGWNIEARHTGPYKPMRQVLVVPPLIQVCQLLRNESVDTFDKRMAGALVEKEGAKWFADMCYAELSERYRKRTWVGGGFDALVAQLAVEKAEEAYAQAQSLVMKERENLGLEASRV